MLNIRLLMMVMAVLFAAQMEAMAAPQAPSLIGATAASTGGNVQLNWNGVSGAVGYWVCASLPYYGCSGGTDAENGKWQPATGGGQKSTTLNLSAGHYTWKVRACDSGNHCSGWSSYKTFDAPLAGSSAKFSQTLANTYKSPRCVNCHHFKNSANRSSQFRYMARQKSKESVRSMHFASRPAGISMFRPKPGTKWMHTAANRSPNCTNCHMSAWTPAPKEQDFLGKSNYTLCLMTKRRFNNNPAAIKQHLKEDPRIIWAISSASGPVADSSGKAPPGNISQWNTMVDQWVDGGMHCN